MAEYTKAKAEANHTRLFVSVPKEDRQQFRQKCTSKGISQTSILKDAIYKFLKDE